MNQLFYTPKNAAVGDVIPFYAKGEFKIFYLHLSRDPVKNGLSLPWYLLGPQNFLAYQEYGPSGILGGTGAFLQADGVYHLNNCIVPVDRQLIAHAISHTLITWKTHPEEDFGPDPEFYAATDWRDPFVFLNEETDEYWMLISTQSKSQYNRNGCVRLCVYKDLSNWQERPPFFAPNLYISVLECPDLFRRGNWWNLVYSTYNDRFATHYRMSNTTFGPWLAPAEDTFDGRAFYTAKSCTDNRNRFLFVWNPTRTENTLNWNPPSYPGKDIKTLDWGGNLVVHHIERQPNGTVSIHLPDRLADAFQQNQAIKLRADLGKWEMFPGGCAVFTPDSFACATSDTLPECFMISATMQYRPGTRCLGFVIRANASLDRGSFNQIEPDRNRIVYNPFVFTDEHGGKILPHEIDLKRPMQLSPNQDFQIKILVDACICEVYLDDQVAMSTRIYDLQQGSFGFFVTDNEAVFKNI